MHVIHRHAHSQNTHTHEIKTKKRNFLKKNCFMWAYEMTRWAKALAAKSDVLSLIPGMWMVKGENPLLKVVRLHTKTNKCNYQKNRKSLHVSAFDVEYQHNLLKPKSTFKWLYCYSQPTPLFFRSRKYTYTIQFPITRTKCLAEAT